MAPLAVNMTVKRRDMKNKYSNKYVICICALFSILILFRSLSNIGLYLFIAVGFAVFATSSVKHCLSFLLFLLPFASILKLDVASISFFTPLFFLVILKMVIARPKIEVGVVIGVMASFIYNIIFSGLGQLTTIITIIAGILMLYYVRRDPMDADSAVIVFSFGVCISSLLALFKSVLPYVNMFIADSILRLKKDSTTTRFAGLQGNPNYYTLDIIIALAAIIVLMNNNKSRMLHTILFVTLSVFGLMSVSKSFLVTWFLLIVLWFLLSIKKGSSGIVKFVFIALIALATVYYFAYDYINAYLFRFSQDVGVSLGSVTTGRTDIWIKYINEILDNTKVLFLGNGLNTILSSARKGTHNTYLESLFYLGIVGTTIFLATIKAAIGKINLKNAVWILWIVLAVRMIAVGILTYDSLWFYFVIIILLSQNEIKEETISLHSHK